MRFVLCVLPLFFLGLVAAQYSSIKALPGSCAALGGVAVDSRAGTLFAACSGVDTIMAWTNSTSNGTVLLGAGKGCTYPEDLFWDAARGSLFAACNGYPTGVGSIVQITRVNNTTVTEVVLPANYGNCDLHYVYVDVDNSVYGTCDATGVLKWTDVTKPAVRLSDNGYCMYSRQIAVNPVTGDVFLACMGGVNLGRPYPSRVLRWAGGAGTASIFSTCGMAQGAAVAGNGDLYVGCGSDNKVVKFAFNAATHQYSTTPQPLNGTCQGSDGVNLKWASNGLFATCVTENALKFWSLSALNTNSPPTIISSGNTIVSNIAVSTYGETVFTGNGASGVLAWQLL